MPVCFFCLLVCFVRAESSSWRSRRKWVIVFLLADLKWAKTKTPKKKVYQHYGLNPQLGIPLGEDQLVSIPRKQREDHVERSRIIPLN